jgi:hypothetical protein
MALTESDGKKNKSYGNDKAALKAKAERMLVADVSANDIKLINKFTNKSSKVSDVRDLEEYAGLGLSKGEHAITDAEIKKVISGEIKKPTGIHKKKK